VSEVVQSQLRAVLDSVTLLFGERVVGAYLYGSGVLGKLRPASDVDVFVLLSGATRLVERRTFVSELLRVSRPPGNAVSGRPIDVTMARWDELRPWPPNPRREFQYGEWLRRDYEAGFVPEPIVDPDLAAQVATLLTASRPLTGPPVESLLDPIPNRELIGAMRNTVPVLLDELADDTVNVLLTLARIAYTVSCGHIVAKDEAALWASTQLPSELREPITQARLIYLGEVDPTSQHLGSNPVRTANGLVYQLIDPARDGL
jgi:streptomycin 3"-adenylyltransferase